MAKEFGWAYVVGRQGSGPKGSVQLAGSGTELEHDPNLIWSDDLNALLVSGNIVAHNFEIQNQTQTVFHFEVSGSSVFGDTPDDLHQFTGSIDTSGSITAHSFQGYGGDLEGVAINEYTNSGDNRLVTSVNDNTVNAEENLTFDGALLDVIGDIQAIQIEATQVSGGLGLYENLTANQSEVQRFINGALTIENSSISNAVNIQASTIEGTLTSPAQTNITSVGTLSSLNVAADTNLGGPLAINKNTADRMVDIKDAANPQLRLTNTEYVFGLSQRKYVDFNANATGDLEILPQSGKVIIPQLNLTNLQQGTASSFLSVDSNGNVILAPSVQSGIEVRNRIVVNADYSMATDDYFVGLQATQNLTVTLPDASTLLNGQIFVIKDEAENADIYSLNVVAQPNQLIENRSSLNFASTGASITIYTDGVSKFFIM